MCIWDPRGVKGFGLRFLFATLHKHILPLGSAGLGMGLCWRGEVVMEG